LGAVHPATASDGEEWAPATSAQAVGHLRVESKG
jgi:hypothetical protein